MVSTKALTNEVFGSPITLIGLEVISGIDNLISISILAYTVCTGK